MFWCWVIIGNMFARECSGWHVDKRENNALEGLVNRHMLVKSSKNGTE